MKLVTQKDAQHTLHGNACHAEGDYIEYKKSDNTYEVLITESAGLGTHAEGVGTVAASTGAHAEGHADVGTYGVLTGRRVQSVSTGSHAEGIGTYSLAPGAHAEGIDCEARAPAAHAEGFYTIAKSSNQHVVGKYNIADSINKYAEIVGGGNSDTTRKNIRTLDWNGNEYVSGSSTAKTIVANDSMTVGGTTFSSANVIKWNKNSGQDTSDFELAGFIIAEHTSTGNNVIYYPVNEAPVNLGTNITNAELFRLAKNRCRKMSIQCASNFALNFANIYSDDIVGKTFEVVFANTKTSGDIVVHLANNYDSTDKDNIRFINAVNNTGIPSRFARWQYRSIRNEGYV